jgi:hypothetical protein
LKDVPAAAISSGFRRPVQAPVGALHKWSDRKVAVPAIEADYRLESLRWQLRLRGGEKEQKGKRSRPNVRIQWAGMSFHLGLLSSEQCDR